MTCIHGKVELTTPQARDWRTAVLQDTRLESRHDSPGVPPFSHGLLLDPFMYIGSLDSGRDYVRAGVFPKHGPGEPPLSKSGSWRMVVLQERVLENGGSPASRLGERRSPEDLLGER